MLDHALRRRDADWKFGRYHSRALDVLRAVDLIAAEDTRHSGIANAFGIKKPLLSYHEHNEAMRTAHWSSVSLGGQCRPNHATLDAWAFRYGRATSRMHRTRAAIHDRARAIVDSTALVGSGFSM